LAAQRSWNVSDQPTVLAKRSSVIGSSPYLNTRYSQDIGLFAPSLKRVVLVLLMAGAVLGLPAIASASILNVSNYVLLAIVGATGLQIVTGMGAQLSLGHAAFMAVGGFVSMGMYLQAGTPSWLIIIMSALGGMLVGFISGIPALRLRGFYLGITTLAVQAVVSVAALKFQVYLQNTFGTTTDLTLPVLSLAGIDISSNERWFYLLLIFALLSIAFLKNLTRSSFGRDTAAMRQKEVVAESLGINVKRVKLMAFALSGLFGGLCGTLQTFYFSQASVEDFNLNVSVEFLAIIIVGGLGVTAGVVYGAIFVTSTTYLVGDLISRFGLEQTLGPKQRGIELGIFAITMIAFLILEPEGIAGVWNRVRGYFQLWPYKYTSTARAKR
jgi:branched-chain amino acid transport system permease protein